MIALRPTLCLLACATLLLPGFTTQPLEEREAQQELPQSKDKLWDRLGATKVNFNDETGIYNAQIPADIKALDKTTVAISGFVLPLETEEKFTHFLLSKRTPTCPFCPPGEPNEIVEVFAETPLEWDDNLVTYEGVFELTKNEDLGVFFKLTKARKK